MHLDDDRMILLVRVEDLIRVEDIFDELEIFEHVIDILILIRWRYWIVEFTVGYGGKHELDQLARDRYGELTWEMNDYSSRVEKSY